MNRFITYVKRNIRRTPYQAIAASMVMFLTFVTLLGFIVLAIGSQKILQYYESVPQVIAFFKDNTTNEDISAIIQSLEKTHSIASIKKVTKEEALQDYKEKNKNQPALIELVTANILPSSIEISTTTPQELDTVAQLLKNEPVVDDVVYPEDVIQNLTKATSVARWIGGVVVIFSILFGLLIIVMVIGFKIRIKRTEIEIMHLLGASDWFIRAPFIIEGIAYGLTGALLAWILIYGVLWYITPFFQQNATDINLLPASPLIMLGLLATAALVSIIIGGIGSFAAVRRYLKL